MLQIAVTADSAVPGGPAGAPHLVCLPVPPERAREGMEPQPPCGVRGHILKRKAPRPQPTPAGAGLHPRCLLTRQRRLAGASGGATDGGAGAVRWRFWAGDPGPRPPARVLRTRSPPQSRARVRAPLSRARRLCVGDRCRRGGTRPPGQRLPSSWCSSAVSAEDTATPELSLFTEDCLETCSGWRNIVSSHPNSGEASTQPGATVTRAVTGSIKQDVGTRAWPAGPGCLLPWVTLTGSKQPERSSPVAEAAGLGPSEPLLKGADQTSRLWHHFGARKTRSCAPGRAFCSLGGLCSCVLFTSLAPPLCSSWYTDVRFCARPRPVHGRGAAFCSSDVASRRRSTSPSHIRVPSVLLKV